MSELPYFDVLLEKFREGKDAELEEAFGLNVHWGYWEDPMKSDASATDFKRAALEMTRQVCREAGLHDGMRVLDVGCGFGGTLHEINESYSNMDCVGLNIDPRQLERAKQLVVPKNGNRIAFVEGDACQLPFTEKTFDAVLAVECVFHFPSRAKFFQHAHRVLKPSGRLTVSDYVPRGATLPLFLLAALPAVSKLSQVYGSSQMTTRSGYRSISKRAGFGEMNTRDITANTLPTYDVLDRIAKSFRSAQISEETQMRGNRFLRQTSERGWLRYLILSFR